MVSANSKQLLSNTAPAAARRKPFIRRVLRRLRVEFFKLLGRVRKLTAALVYLFGRSTGLAVRHQPLEYRDGELDVTVRRYIELIDFMNEAKIRHSSSVLDVGCAPGRLAERLYRAGFNNIEGCDWKPECELVERVRGQLRYRQVDLNAAALESYDDAAFDVVICSDVLEHLEHPARMLREFARVTAPGGNIFITLPNGFNLLERWHILKTGNSSRYRSERGSSLFGHISMLPTWVLESLCDRAGLEVVAEGQGFMWWNYFWFPNRRFSHLFSYYAYYQLRHKLATNQPFPK
ncbi:MAG TPA: class I SAM-dependent methyltransferase [Blastocatellia bacterium]|nr:class I SAM-dependent methyltransferase [Blastocatellia bacterium]